MQYNFGVGLGKDSKTTYHLWEFDSIKELADAAKGPDGTVHLKSDRPLSDTVDFNVTESVDEAYLLATDGWHDIRSRVDAHLVPLREKLGEVLEVVRERIYDVTGGEPCIDRYLDDELECMVDDLFEETPKTGKVFTIVLDSTLVCYNSADDVLKRGATLCALVEAFDMLGFQLEIWGEWTYRGETHKELASILTRFNHAGEPLDVDTLMFAVGNPDWFRRLGFALGENLPVLRNTYGFNGRYYGYQKNGVHFAERVCASSVVSLEGGQRMVTDPVEWILEQLRIQGVVDDG